jgi:protein-S-isoprenylcysteine O-methyltransferase Ste14
MIFKDQQDNSFWNKILFTFCVFCSIYITVSLMFAEYLPLNVWSINYRLNSDLVRRILVAFCLIVYFIRFLFSVWVFSMRRWTWLETIIITILMSFAFFAFGWFGGNNKTILGVFEMIGIILYLSGSYINSSSEYFRHAWKKKIENKGHIYTKGLFKYSMHINYFGEIILFTGFAMVTHSIIPLLIALVMTANFIFNIIPLLDKYLEKKYDDEFREYSGKTKKLIPFLY